MDYCIGMYVCAKVMWYETVVYYLISGQEMYALSAFDPRRVWLVLKTCQFVCCQNYNCNMQELFIMCMQYVKRTPARKGFTKVLN